MVYDTCLVMKIFTIGLPAECEVSPSSVPLNFHEFSSVPLKCPPQVFPSSVPLKCPPQVFSLNVPLKCSLQSPQIFKCPPQVFPSSDHLKIPF